MQVRPDRPVASNTTGCDDDLLRCRMAMLGLDLDAIERGDGKAFAELKKRCAGCEFQEPCAVDLKRDPNNPVWEAYCPNSALLNGLTETWWANTLT